MASLIASTLTIYGKEKVVVTVVVISMHTSLRLQAHKVVATVNLTFLSYLPIWGPPSKQHLLTDEEVNANPNAGVDVKVTALVNN